MFIQERYVILFVLQEVLYANTIYDFIYIFLFSYC